MFWMRNKEKIQFSLLSGGMGVSFQDYSCIQDFEANVWPQNPEFMNNFQIES